MVAVVPWIRHVLPGEDRLLVRGATVAGVGAVAVAADAVRVAIVGYPYAANTDEFDALSTEAGVHLEVVGASASLAGFGAVVLPGSRNSVASLRWMQECGLDAELRVALRRGAVVLGICGGMQMLGRSIADDHGLESGPAPGLGLLDVTTALVPAKVTRQVMARLVPTDTIVRGYEIHHGTTFAGANADPLLTDGLGWQQLAPGGGLVMGVYAHGLFEDGAFRSWFLRRAGVDASDRDWSVALDAEITSVSRAVDATGLVEHVLAALIEPVEPI